MAKAQEELNELKIECETLTTKLQELNEDELKMVLGGLNIREIGMVFQQYHLFPHVTVGENKSLDSQTSNRIMRDAKITEGCKELWQKHKKN